MKRLYLFATASFVLTRLNVSVSTQIICAFSLEEAKDIFWETLDPAIQRSKPYIHYQEIPRRNVVSWLKQIDDR